VINIDVRAFFDEVRHRVVYRMLRKELAFGREVARLITQLTTLRAALPQGSPTSTVLANLVLAAPIDTAISRSARQLDVEYTRFVDDISFSGNDPRPLINEVGKLLSRRGLRMHRKKGIKPKLKIMPRSKL
jgi:RNA-directed DNA polymerase